MATVTGPGTPGAAQTVRSGPAHAERGPGADPLLSGAPVPSAAKAAGRAHPKGGQVMLEECGPLVAQGAALTGGRAQGRTWAATDCRACRRSRLRPPIGAVGP